MNKHRSGVTGADADQRLFSCWDCRIKHTGRHTIDGETVISAVCRACTIERRKQTRHAREDYYQSLREYYEDTHDQRALDFLELCQEDESISPFSSALTTDPRWLAWNTRHDGGQQAFRKWQHRTGRVREGRARRLPLKLRKEP